MDNAMKLSEIAKGYREAEAVIREHLKILRAARKETKDLAERQDLKGQIHQLEVIYTQLRQVAKICENYYDRGFYVDREYRV